MIELRQLKYFIRIAELEHFGQAASELHVVQPALSRQMKQLEEALGVDLFERLPRGVRLTAAGHVLLDRARVLMTDVERTIVATQMAGQGKTGFVRVGFADGATYSGDVPEIIREFRKHTPQVELELQPASSLNQSGLLLRESIDVGFVYWLPEDCSNVSHHEVNRENVVLAVAKSNPLATRKSISLNDLGKVPFVWFKRANAPGFYDLMAKQCSRAGLILNVIQEAFTESTMLSLVSADIGATFITEEAEKRKPDNVVLRKVKDVTAQITLKAMWRTDDRNPALREFVKVIRSHKRRK